MTGVRALPKDEENQRGIKDLGDAANQGGPEDIEIKTTVASYENAVVPFIFDLLISAMFAPFGGITRLRSQALDLLEMAPRLSVLELGCGTGGLTRLLLDRGVLVTSIDGSERMLARARRRAPDGNFQRQQLESLNLQQVFDLVILSFVLHELPRQLRAKTLTSVKKVIAPNGVIAVLDHAVPSTRGLTRLWRGLLMRLEPPSVVDCIQGGFEAELEECGMGVVKRYELARGTAMLLVAR